MPDLTSKLSADKERIAELQEKCNESELNVQKFNSEIKQIKKEKAILEEDLVELNAKNRELEENKNKFEEELSSTCDQAELNIKNLQEKYESMHLENEKLKENFEDYKNNESVLRKQLEESNKAKDTYKNKYMDIKKLNKTMKKKLESIEDDVQLFMKERENELEESLKKEQADKIREQSRIEAIRDVNYKINQFKTERGLTSSPYKKLI